MKKIFFFALISLLISIVNFPATAQTQKGHPFVADNYPSPQFHIHKKYLKHGDVGITVIEVSNTDDEGTGHPNDWDCRAWLTIQKNGKVLKQYYFDSIDAAGENPYGLLVPPKQPTIKYFFVQKIGDYNSIIYMIDTDGNVIQIPGNSYYMAEHSRYLFIPGSEAEDGPTVVFDLEKNKTIYSKKIPNFSLYQKNDLYFFTKVKLSQGGKDEAEDKENILLFDFVESKFVSKTVDQDFWAGAHKMKEGFPLENYDCNCGDNGTSGKPPL